MTVSERSSDPRGNPERLSRLSTRSQGPMVATSHQLWPSAAVDDEKAPVARLAAQVAASVECLNAPAVHALVQVSRELELAGGAAGEPTCLLGLIHLGLASAALTLVRGEAVHDDGISVVKGPDGHEVAVCWLGRTPAQGDGLARLGIDEGQALWLDDDRAWAGLAGDGDPAEDVQLVVVAGQVMNAEVPVIV